MSCHEDKGIVAPFPPHVMFYGPYLTNAGLGSDGNRSRALLCSQ
jgi:hypothetical protein